MSYNWNTRTELLFGAEHMERLSRSHVLVVGLGGVGAYAAEQICRAGVGKMTIIDADTVNESNINRQLPALHSTLGMPKAEVVAKRLLDINPQLQLTVLNEFLRDERTEEVLLSAPLDFVVDAIDSLSPKVYLMYQAYIHKIPIVSSMGGGAKVDPSLVRIAISPRQSIGPRESGAETVASSRRKQGDSRRIFHRVRRSGRRDRS